MPGWFWYMALSTSGDRGRLLASLVEKARDDNRITGPR